VRVNVRAPQFRVRISPLFEKSGLSEDLLHSAIRHIRVSRQMGSAAGSFQLTILPRYSREPWTRMLSPMDYVEISLWVPPREPRVVMRGFVDTVAESFTIESGTPQWQIIVAGRDYGKIGLITKLFYLDLERRKIPQELKLFQDWQTGFDALGAGDRYRGITPAAKRIDSSEQTPSLTHPGVQTPPNIPVPKYFYTAPQIMAVVFETFLEPQFNLIREQYNREKPPLPGLVSTQDALDEQMVTMAPQYMLRSTWQPYTDVWALLRTYQNAPWRELYWDDEPNGPVLITRPTPWLSEGGKFLSEVAATVQRVDLDGTDIVAQVLSRTDEEVRNFFFTYPGVFASFVAPTKLFGTDYEGMMARGGQLFRENPILTTEADSSNFRFSSDYRIYGLRLAEFPSQYFDYDTMLKKDEVKSAWERLRQVGATANKRLVEALGHGGILENGTLSLKGNEEIRLGCYLNIPPWPFAGYVERLTHEFVQGSTQDGRFMTTVGITRGRRQVVRPGSKILDVEVSLP
jgi:hypothetical protein